MPIVLNNKLPLNCLEDKITVSIILLFSSELKVEQKNLACANSQLTKQSKSNEHFQMCCNVL